MSTRSSRNIFATVTEIDTDSADLVNLPLIVARIG